ncbi:hypothetical protein HG536_0B06860 [Torulaspora globosa]|uniref:Ferroxidase n=1 Tax=Torulaspora globosa TaxID=48254 RepID=A0A7G3ZE82_9SACH|nr:uncharacterized protein HG536_0B06860 [Torulaspora globosa]QLL31818.1 hypothetical protein HG536_0B06860 [Torulaspora globosa]
MAGSSLCSLMAVALLACASVVSATVHTFNFTTGWVDANPDGVREKKMIGFNGQWPVPDIHVKKGDRVQLYLTNGFDDGTVTSLHFHGMFQKLSDGNRNEIDGPSMVTQCPIVPGQTYLYNFTVADQVGTYWYHAHSGSQFGDGMRGAFIIHDDDEPFHYDEEMVIQLSDLYWKPYYEVTQEFMSRYNPTGAEPIPQNLLFNNTLNATLDFEPGKTYLMRFINSGLFVSQYVALEEHELTIVEVDGVYVKPNVTDLLYIATGQRMSVLVKAKEHDPGRNFALMQMMDEVMLDVVPPELVRNRTHQISYNRNYEAAESFIIDDFDSAAEEFYLAPLDDIKLLDHYDTQITFNLSLNNLGDGVNYAMFNGITYVHPKVPTLTTVLTSGELATDARIYGDNVNAIVLQKDEIVEVVVNNYDSGKHPFHLHGHNFQLIQKSPEYRPEADYPEYDQDKITVPYNESAPLMPFPEYPVLRDTVVLAPSGHIVIRFKADNPGVWFFHCHLDWHLTQGLGAVFIEDPLSLQESETLSDNYKQLCSAAEIPNRGNAAGHTDDWYNMEGLPRQPRPLPSGFTAKGYFAFIVSTLVGLLGIYTISDYGLSETISDDQAVYDTLKGVLDANGISY